MSLLVSRHAESWKLVQNFLETFLTQRPLFPNSNIFISFSENSLLDSDSVINCICVLQPLLDIFVERRQLVALKRDLFNQFRERFLLQNMLQQARNDSEWARKMELPQGVTVPRELWCALEVSDPLLLRESVKRFPGWLCNEHAPCSLCWRGCIIFWQHETKFTKTLWRRIEGKQIENISENWWIDAGLKIRTQSFRKRLGRSKNDAELQFDGYAYNHQWLTTAM